MFIKKITIQGFKSYRDQTVIEPLSPKHSVIVGRNGSGKSNFFAAIRFVLSDKYSNLGKEERQALLHEGSGSGSLAAFVEIIFDNKDSRFPNNKEELILRRSVGLKKDEYSIDKKTTTKADVVNLLESAGFSRSNPYYIVPQGRVTSLTHAKDNERLELLKEVAGTRVYENRRKESMKILEDTENKKQKIEELLEFIQERLNELESEKKELQEFTKMDDDRRSLEYTLYSQEKKEIVSLLAEIDKKRATMTESDKTKSEEFYQRESELNEFNQQLLATKQQLDVLSNEKRHLLEDRREQFKNQTQVKLAISDIQNSFETEGQRKAQLANEFEQVQKEINDSQQQLNQLTPKYEKAANEVKIAQENYNKEDFRRQTLVTKQGRGSQFTNKKDRDNWLKNEIKSIKETIRSEQNSLSKIEADQVSCENELTTAAQDKEKLKQLLEEHKNKLLKIIDEVNHLKQERDNQTDEHKNLQREDFKSDTAIKALQDELRGGERNLSGLMNQNTSIGLATVAKLAKDMNLKGYYGPLYELFEFPEEYQRAIETTAGSRLFHIVVDSDETASTLLQAMSKRKEGRITFMPLNRLKTRKRDYNTVRDAQPLISAIEFDSKFQKAFENIFANTIICENLEIASDYSRRFDFDAMTLEGDRVDNHGALFGGYYDTRRSRLEFVKRNKQLAVQLHDAKLNSESIKKSVAAMDQKITQILSRIQSLGSEKKKLIALRDPTFSELSAKHQQEVYLLEVNSQKKKAAEELKIIIGNFNSKIEAYNSELKSNFITALSNQEEVQLKSLNSTVEGLRSSLIEKMQIASELENQVNLLNNKLHSNLERRRIELTKQLANLNEVITQQEDTALESKQEELRNTDNYIAQLNEAIKDTDTKYSEKTQELETLQKQIDELQILQEKMSKGFTDQQKKFEQFLARRTILQQKREDCDKNIRELGALPEQAYRKYSGTATVTLQRKLLQVKVNLKPYSHVNKRATQQHTNFLNQKDSLLNRKSELDNSEIQIKELIQTLDARKDEAIQFTFRQVSNNFATIFEKLVPAGRGQLIIQTGPSNASQLSTQTQNGKSAANGNGMAGTYMAFTGVAISVSFNNKYDEGLLMSQLSGGQKSLVALALIFAIQKCDPAPFYLFDEIDANLDAAHRTSVANMVHELSENAQFVTTTFRPELLVHADQFYGVSFSNKVSRIGAITKEKAKEFVEAETNQ